MRDLRVNWNGSTANIIITDSGTVEYWIGKDNILKNEFIIVNNNYTDTELIKILNDNIEGVN